MAKYKVLVAELSVPRSIGELRDIYGNVVGYSHINRTFYQNDVLDESEVSPVVQELVEKGDYTRLEKVSDDVESGPSSATPIVGYDDLSIEAVRGLFDHLPSETIQRVKEYERAHQNRPQIAEYVIGLGEASVDRIEGNVGSDRDDATEKDNSLVTTREVGEDTVQFGESLTGDGQPDVEPGTAAKKRAARSSDSSAKPKRARRKAASSADDQKSEDTPTDDSADSKDNSNS